METIVGKRFFLKSWVAHVPSTCPILQPATRGQLRCFGFTLGSCHVIHLYKQAMICTRKWQLHYYFDFISHWSSLPAEEPKRTDSGWAPPLGQVTLCSITGSDRKAADSSLDPYSQPSHLKHTHTHTDKVIIFRKQGLDKQMMDTLQVDERRMKGGWRDENWIRMGGCRDEEATEGL